MNPIIYLIYMLLEVYNFILIIWIVLSWLIHFNIVNSHQPLVSRLNFIFYRITEPVLRPIRRFIPPLGGIDLSPILLFIAINFIQYTLKYYSYY